MRGERRGKRLCRKPGGEFRARVSLLPDRSTFLGYEAFSWDPKSLCITKSISSRSETNGPALARLIHQSFVRPSRRPVE